jgi:multidrug efflux pump subunit AcrB
MKKVASIASETDSRAHLSEPCRLPGILLTAYVVVALLVLVLITPRIAEEIFPSAASTQFRLRIDAPDGTRVRQ